MEKIWTWWCTLTTITSVGQPQLSQLCTGIVSGNLLSAGWQTMTAHFKMFKKIVCTPLGKLGDRQGGMHLVITENLLGSQKRTKTYQLTAEDITLSLWSKYINCQPTCLQQWMQRILSSCTDSCVPQLNLLMTYMFMIHKSMVYAQLHFLYIHIAILNMYTSFHIAALYKWLPSTIAALNEVETYYTLPSIH